MNHWGYFTVVPCRCATRGGIWGICLPKIFKTFHSNFDICRNFQRIKMKFYILIIFKISHWNFSLSCSLKFVSLQDLSWDWLPYRKFRKWLVFNHKYAGSVNLGDSLKCSYFWGIFYLLFCLRQASICPHETYYNIRVLLNRANCWNFQSDKRNLDITVSVSSNRLFFYDLLIIIFVRGKADHHY